VGDDAEFQMEFEKHGAWWENDERDGDEHVSSNEFEYTEAASYFGGVPLIFVTGDAREAIWGWKESLPMPFTLSELHTRWGIGSGVLETAELPTEASLAHQSEGPADSCGSPEFEVIALSHDDEIVLQAAASELMRSDRPLRERMIGEMLEMVLGIVEAAPSRDTFWFACPLTQAPLG
jgi:hypothetical protein